MDDRNLSIYVRELVRQCEVAVTARRRLDHLLASGGPAYLVLDQVQSIVGAAAMVSKLCWFSPLDSWSAERRAFAKARAARLRKVAMPPTILSGRAVRNAIEHFDDRLDDLFFADPNAAVVDGNVMPRNFLVMDRPVPWLRHYDPETTEMSVLGSAVRLDPLVKAMQETSARAQHWLERQRV